MDEESIVWYVRDGVMCCGYVLAELEFEYRPTRKDQKDNMGYLGYFIKANGETTGSPPRGIVNMAKKPGIWLLLSGKEMVHGEDVFMTREEAANDAFKSLMKGDPQ